MEYIYSQEKNYEHLASGRVLYNAPGATAFPVRLASEMIQRCFKQLRDIGVKEPYTLYDPCCGGGYLLTVCGFLHGNSINKIIASDIDEAILTTAERNLTLLSKDGLNKRKRELSDYIDAYGKQSHQDALLSAEELDKLHENTSLKEISVFRADCASIDPNEERCNEVHIILTDVPYGDLAEWKGAGRLETFFESMHTIAKKQQQPLVLAIAADKGQKLQHDSFKRLQYGKVGKRHFGIFTAYL